jgi:hypothetical protein
MDQQKQLMNMKNVLVSNVVLSVQGRRTNVASTYIRTKLCTRAMHGASPEQQGYDVVLIGSTGHVLSLASYRNNRYNNGSSGRVVSCSGFQLECFTEQATT